ncbi:hypothetical protein JCM30237_24420 [Halolamina litorea]|uniref:Helix-turn-helix domain-containing protein n=1 Tax=Halolamina litorea TaxID=1515593 RepID=A0ABD6BUZ9_9EURY|nr:helix-turn-helix domain-containing protein [Halolamina litorea]
MSDRKQLTPTQQAILNKAKENPGWQNTEIAEAVGCSDSHVSRTLNKWSPNEMDSDGTVPKNDSPSLIGTLLWATWWLIKISVWVLLWPISVPYFAWKLYRKAGTDNGSPEGS